MKLDLDKNTDKTKDIEISAQVYVAFTRDGRSKRSLYWFNLNDPNQTAKAKSQDERHSFKSNTSL